MTEHILTGHLMTVRTEVWALAADDDGIWLICGGGDAWRSRPIAKDTDPHWAVQKMLRKHGALGSARIVHSTSWRAEGESIVLTYVAVVECPEIRAHWPGAELVSTLLPDIWGPPRTHAAHQPPSPRYADVLLHAIRHLRFLEQNSATEAAQLSPAWKRHLLAFSPALAGMYSQVHGAA